ncbi:MAG TPA: VOC family protein [Sphingomonadaceae bacterium]|nr:VOC family protein [Sphingomonadaceae bacterium]
MEEETLSWGQRFGAVMQVAYVVADLRKAIDFYQKALGTGPFFVLEHVTSPARIYRGKNYPAETSLGMAFSGNVNVELIQVHDNAPSVLREGIERYGYGFHHFGVPFADVEAAEARYKAEGYVEVSRNPVPTGGEVVFLDPPNPAQPGYIELLPVNPGMDETFRRFWAAAQDWDGRDPIRPFV